MKKIINDPEHVVSEMLAGIEISDSSLKYIPGFEVIARREPNKEKVAIISGGGSGHEPAHAGYVGLGMLDAAVAAMCSRPRLPTASSKRSIRSAETRAY